MIVLASVTYAGRDHKVVVDDYLREAQAVYPDLAMLASDIGWISQHGFNAGFRWNEWLSAGRDSYTAALSDVYSYAFGGFVLLLPDFNPSPTDEVDFQGGAATVAEWARRHADEYLALRPNRLGGKELSAILERSVALDKENRTKAVIDADLDQERIVATIADLLAGRYSVSVVEPHFRAVGAWTLCTGPSPRDTARGWARLLPKEPFANIASSPRMSGFSQDGHAFERDLVERLFDALPPPSERIAIESDADVQRYLDVQLETGRAFDLIVLDGDWASFPYSTEHGVVETRVLQLSQASPHLVGTYRDVPVIQTLRSEGPRRLGLASTAAWARLVRYQMEGQDASFEITEVTRAQAQALVRAQRPSLAPASTEFEEEVRERLQFVRLDAAEAVEVQVQDPTRAWTVASIELPVDAANESPTT